VLSPANFRDIVSGRRRGLTAALWRAALRVTEIPYAAAMRIRNWRYDRNPSRAVRVSVPVVSVGNLTLGGTGKTPCVEWLARWFRQRGVRVSIVSRGYGAENGGRNDEARELEEKLPDVPHVQNPDRVAAANLAIEELATQLILLDDAFQHRRIARDLDIVLIDALEPFGHGHVFPRGTLREPLSGARRADAFILTKADQIDDDERQAIRQRYHTLNPTAIWCETAHRPLTLRDAAGEEHTLEMIRGQSVAAFCAIGNPAAFRRTLADCGTNLLELREFPDHHLFTRDDVTELNRWAAAFPATAILCTHKDLVKLGVPRLGEKPHYAVRIGLGFMTGEQELDDQLQQVKGKIDIQE